MHQDSITFIVQGPLHENLKRSLPIYARYGKIIVSCWNTCHVEHLANIPQDTPYKLICSKKPTEDDMNRLSHIFQDPSQWGGSILQMITIKNAIYSDHIDTKYVIKVRSDEVYENLDVFIDKLRNLSNKHNVEDVFITGNLFVFHSKYWRYHVSDHIFGCSTRSMKRMFDLLNHFIKIPPENEERVVPNIVHEFYKYVPGQVDTLHPEQLLGIAFVYQIGIEAKDVLERKAYNRVMLQYVHVVKMEDMMPFELSYRENDIRVTQKNPESNYLWVKSTLDMLDDNGKSNTSIEESMFFVRVGQSAYLRNDWKNCVEYFQRIPKEYRQGNAAISLNIGVGLAKQKQFNEALHYFNEVIQHANKESHEYKLAVRNVGIIASYVHT